MVINDIEALFCINCRAPRRGKFCTYCGGRLIKAKHFCRCGATINLDEGDYCSSCGKVLTIDQVLQRIEEERPTPEDIIAATAVLDAQPVPAKGRQYR